MQRLCVLYNPLYYISDICRDVDEVFTLLGPYTAYFGNYLPKFREGTLIPSSRVKAVQEDKSTWITLPLEIRPIGCPDILVNKRLITLHNNSKERISHLTFYLNQFLDISEIKCLLCGIRTI
jgi:hypothetical protein